MTRTDYVVVTAVGALIHTFAERRLAREWLAVNASAFPGLRLEEVTVTTQRRTLWRDRAGLRVVA